MATPAQLFHLITQAHRARKAAIARQAKRLKNHGLTPLDWAIMLSLLEKPGQSQVEIARSIGKASSNIRTPIEVLDRKGWLHRETGLTDRRVNLTYLSHEGEKLAREIQPLFQSLDKDLLEGASATEQKQAEKLLQLILKNAEKL